MTPLQFIQIKSDRIRISSIKKYRPVAENKLVVWFSTSRYKVENETYTFETEEELRQTVDFLDTKLL